MSFEASTAKSVSPPDRPAQVWARTGPDQLAPPLVEVNSGLPPAELMLPIPCGPVTNSLWMPPLPAPLSAMIVGSPSPVDCGICTGQVNPLLGALVSGDPGVQVVVGTVVLVVEVVVDVEVDVEVELEVVVVPPCLACPAFCEAAAVETQPPNRPRTAST